MRFEFLKLAFSKVRLERYRVPIASKILRILRRDRIADGDLEEQLCKLSREAVKGTRKKNTSKRITQFKCDIFRTDLENRVLRSFRSVFKQPFYPLRKQKRSENAGKQIQNTSRKTCGVLFKAPPSKSSRNYLFSQKKAESALKYVPG